MNAEDRLIEFEKKITVDYSDNVNLTSYFRMCRSMLVMAGQYEKENSLGKAYALEKRFLILFLDYLTNRKDFMLMDASFRNTWAKECNRVLGSVEQMRRLILLQFEAEDKDTLEAKLAAAKQVKEKAVHDELELKRLEESRKARQNSVTVVTPSAPPAPSPSIQPPSFDRADKPVVPFTTPRSMKYGWSIMSVPSNLADTFLQVTDANSKMNRETCGTLCGHISSSGFVISHLVFCKQTGTSDSCITTNEEELMEYMENQSLIALGWIHTHPTQSVFMSSLDLHCHLSYQLMLPEAIAIVCSPRYHDTQYFSITPDYGSKFLLNCKQKGFHKHANTQDLYITSPHIVMNDIPVKVIDLR